MLHSHRHVSRIALAVVAQGDRLVRRGLGDADDACRLPAVEDGGVLRGGEIVGGAVEIAEVHVLRTAIGVGKLGTRERERRSGLDEREHAA